MAAPEGNKYAVGNKGGGRISEYKDTFPRMAEKLCKLGAIDKDLADFFEVSEQTINNWKQEYKEFYLALKKGKLIADANVAESLYKRATGYEHKEDVIFNDKGTPLVVPTIKRYPPDTTAMIFWLKNRRPGEWRDKQEISHVANDVQVFKIGNQIISFE